MSGSDDFDAMTDLCIEAARAVMQNGSDELKAIMRVALTVLGRKIAERAGKPVMIEGACVRIGRVAHA